MKKVLTFNGDGGITPEEHHKSAHHEKASHETHFKSGVVASEGTYN